MTTDPTCRECGGLGYVTEDGGREHSPCQSCAAQPVPLSAEEEAEVRPFHAGLAHRRGVPDCTVCRLLATLDVEREARATPSGDLAGEGEYPKPTTVQGATLSHRLAVHHMDFDRSIVNVEREAAAAALRGSVSADSPDPLRVDEAWLRWSTPPGGFSHEAYPTLREAFDAGFRAAIEEVSRDPEPPFKRAPCVHGNPCRESQCVEYGRYDRDRPFPGVSRDH